MKKWITILLALALVLSMTACGTEEVSTPAATEAPITTAPTQEEPAIPETAPLEVPEASADAPDDQVKTHVDAVLADLTAGYEGLIDGVDSYDTYIQKQDEIAAFYETAVAASEDLCSKMYAYALAYTENILTSDASTDDMYDEMDIVYDLIYDDMGDEIYDGIYDGVLDDLYDDFYDGALDDQPDGVEYSDWADARSDEYEQWSDSRSDTYDHWSDFRSDVYDLWADVRSELWDDNLEGALEELEDFRKDVEALLSKA